jgi:hypothetical protein
MDGTIFEFKNSKELEKILRSLHLSMTMLKWTDQGNGPIYIGLC